MCGRYALTSPPSVIAERFHLLWTPDPAPHYNIALGQTIPVVREAAQGRELAFMKGPDSVLGEGSEHRDEFHQRAR